MRKMEDLTGETFGELTVISDLGMINGNHYSECRCSCGNITKVQNGSLKNGRTTKCKSGVHKINDLSGNVYGHLTVLKFHSVKNGNAQWECLCDCGNISVMDASNFARDNGQCKRCALRIHYNYGDIVGDHCIKYLHDVEPSASKSGKIDRKALFECHCGNTFISSIGSVKTGTTTSCGCALRKPKIVYSSGDLVGLNNIMFLNEISPHIDSGGQVRRMARFKCVCGNEFDAVIDDIKTGRKMSCGCIKRSKGSIEVEQYLHKNGYMFKAEYSFDDLKDASLLRFDFAVFRNEEITCLIEYQGRQHYEEVEFWGGFDACVKHDKMKVDYCKKNGIELIVIPYWESVDAYLEEQMKGLVA